jgi:hypothetical protein
MGLPASTCCRWRTGKQNEIMSPWLHPCLLISPRTFVLLRVIISLDTPSC